MGLHEEAEREDVVFVKMNPRARIAYDNHNCNRRFAAQCHYKSGELTVTLSALTERFLVSHALEGMEGFWSHQNRRSQQMDTPQSLMTSIRSS